MKLSIVIPVYNNWNFTNSILNDLFKLEIEHETIVIDNASADETEKEIVKHNIKYIRNDTNEFFAKAINKGYRESCGEYILFLNNDVKIKNRHNDWIDGLIKEANDSIVGPTGGLLDSNLAFVKETKEFIDSKYFYISGWCILANRKTYDKLLIDNKLWCEDYIFYFEDADLSFRAKELGIDLKIVSVPVIHFGKMTAKKIGVNDLYISARTKFVNKWIGKI